MQPDDHRKIQQLVATMYLAFRCAGERAIQTIVDMKLTKAVLKMAKGDELSPDMIALLEMAPSPRHGNRTRILIQ